MSTSIRKPNKVKLAITGGAVKAVYSDAALRITAPLGKATVLRLSTVEFNNRAQHWEVRHKGKLLRRFKNREQALKWEKDFFERRLASLQERCCRKQITSRWARSKR